MIKPQVLKHPVFNTFLPYCGYHTKRCVKVDDHVGKPPLIQHPNEFGMCRLHYTAVFHKQPKSHTITTVPGVSERLFRILLVSDIARIDHLN